MAYLWCNFNLLVISMHRYVHISEATFDSLQGLYKTLPGNGRDRDQYLAEHNVKTYLIDASQVIDWCY